jgi:hypothetical protein
MVFLNRNRTFMILVILLIIVGITIMMVRKDKSMQRAASHTQEFIEQHMVNPNGTIATYLKDAASDHPDIVAGRESLSESLGIWMQYTVLQQDHERFDQSYQLLQKWFIAPQKYITWKLSSDGTSHVNTNALGDDFRIIGALLKAYEQWNQEEYRTTAQEISATLLKSVQKNGYFVDYHDFARDDSSNLLSLVYVDIETLQSMQGQHLMDPSLLQKYMDLLRDMPDDGVFYPKAYDVTTHQYSYDDNANLIDQLIVANHCAEMDLKPEKLIAFLKNEFKSNHRIMGSYNRVDRSAAVDYESPSVYALAILLALKVDDLTWANQLYDRMITFRDQDVSYRGGYVFDQNTHVFDNLFPLLAEAELHQANAR